MIEMWQETNLECDVLYEARTGEGSDMVLIFITLGH